MSFSCGAEFDRLGLRYGSVAGFAANPWVKIAVDRRALRFFLPSLRRIVGIWVAVSVNGGDWNLQGTPQISTPHGSRLLLPTCRQR